MRRHDLQLVPAVDEEATSMDQVEILSAGPPSTPVLRVAPPDEDVTPDDAA